MKGEYYPVLEMGCGRGDVCIVAYDLEQTGNRNIHQIQNTISLKFLRDSAEVW